MKRIFLILISHLFALIVTAQSSYTVYKQFLRIEDGLSSNNVTTAVQDNKGFMWFGTSYGLNKYDGKKFKTFTKAKDGLNSNFIEKLAVDDANQLWIVSGGVLQIMNLVTNEIRNVGDVVQLPFEQNQIVEIANNGSKEIQIITKNPYRLWYYSSLVGCVIRYEFSELNDLNQSAIPYCCFQNGQTAITFSGMTKLFLFRKNENSNLNFEGIERRPIQILNEREVVLVSNEKGVSNGNITEREFVKVNLDNTTIEYLPNYLNDANFDWQNCRILDGSKIPTTSYASRLIGLKLKLNNQEIELLSKEQWNDLNGGSFYSCFNADATNFWYISTNGILHVRLQRKFFENYFMRENVSSHEGQVRGIYAKGFSSSNMQGELRANVWQSQCEIKDGKFKEVDCQAVLFPIEKIQGVFYSANGTLVRLNKDKTKLESLDTIGVSEVWSIFQANDHTILTGRSPGVFAYNLVTKETRELAADNPNWPKPMSIYRFVNSKTKGLVAVAENGLFMISTDLRVIDYFGKDATTEDHRIPVARIYDWREDSKGTCWIATGGEGLISWNWKADGTIDQGKIRIISVEDGFPSTIIYRIEEDDFLNLWISTYNGLVRYNLNTGEFRIFNTYDGLSHNEFNRISSFKDEQGKMYFGGMDGLNVFDPKDFLQSEKENYPLQVVALSKYSEQSGTEVNCDAEFNTTGRLVLYSGDLFLKIDFAFLTYSPTDRGFQYLIEGASETWVELTDNSLQIGALASGEYTVRIRARLPDGTWNPQEIQIPLTVKPPYYLATGFVISAILLLLIFFGAVYKLRSISQRLKLKKLEIQVSKRTTELQTALSDKEILLKEVHHRVKNNLQVVSGLLQLQKDEVKDEALLRAFSEGQSRLKSIALIHKNIYQNENLESVFLHSFISELFNEVKSLFSMKGSVAEGNFNMNNLTLNLQNAVPLGLILNELMTNSFKHALLPNQDLEIRVEMIAIGENEYELTYRDNGPGINSELQPQISESLGMRLIFGLTNQINGKVDFKKGNGLLVNIRFNTEVL